MMLIIDYANSDVLQQAIEHVTETGGGTIYCPQLIIMEGPIVIKSNVILSGYDNCPACERKKE